MTIRQKTVLEIRRQLGTGTGQGTVMGGTVLVGSPPYALDGPALIGKLPLARISTTETDTTLVARPDGTGGVEFAAEAAGGGGTIFAGFDGGGAPLTTATQDIYIRSARTITGWELIADQAGSCTVEVLHGPLADLIAGSPPTTSLGSVALAGVIAATGSLSGSLAAADVVRCALSAVDGVQTKATLTLTTT